MRVEADKTRRRWFFTSESWPRQDRAGLTLNSWTRLIYFVSRGVATYGSISQSRAGYRPSVSMCSYNARGWEYMGVIPWLLPKIQAKSGYYYALSLSMFRIEVELSFEFITACLDVGWS